MHRGSWCGRRGGRYGYDSAAAGSGGSNKDGYALCDMGGGYWAVWDAYGGTGTELDVETGGGCGVGQRVPSDYTSDVMMRRQERVVIWHSRSLPTEDLPWKMHMYMMLHVYNPVVGSVGIQLTHPILIVMRRYFVGMTGLEMVT